MHSFVQFNYLILDDPLGITSLMHKLKKCIILINTYRYILSAYKLIQELDQICPFDSAVEYAMVRHK